MANLGEVNGKLLLAVLGSKLAQSHRQSSSRNLWNCNHYIHVL